MEGRCAHGRRPDERLLYAQAAEISFHVLIKLVLQVHEEANLDLVPVFRRRGLLVADETRNRRVALNTSFLAKLLPLFGGQVRPQPRVVDIRQLVVVELSRRVEALGDTVFIEHLDDRDSRLIAVFGPGIGVDVRE